MNKTKLNESLKKNSKDVGLSEVQIELLSNKIKKIKMISIQQED